MNSKSSQRIVLERHKIPAYAEFRSHQRDQFNAAIAAAARDPKMRLTVETDVNGDSVAIVHRGRLCPAGAVRS